MKKIIYIHQYYRRPDEPGTSRSHWIANYLATNGYKVVLIAQKNSFNKENKNSPLFERVKIENIEVIYIRNAYSNEFSVIRRVWSFFYFMICSTFFVLMEKNVKLLIASSTPISVGFPVLVAKYLKKIDYIFEVRDLWPEVPIEMGVIKNKIIISFSKYFISKVYKKATNIIALSPGMKDGLTAYVKSSKVVVIPNMSKVEYFFPRSMDHLLLKELKLEESTTKIVHFGTMGKVNGLSNFVFAAQIAAQKNLNDIDFILVGSGVEKDRFKNIKANHALNNLKIFDRMPLEKISRLVNLCDISYVGVSKFKILEINSANKFFDSLSAGKPIIINFGGWMQEIIENEKCGLRVKNDDPEDLLNAILYLKNNPTYAMQMGVNARRLAETTYDKSILCKKFKEVVDNILK